MANGRVLRILRCLNQTARRGPADPSDALLLQRFVGDRDDAAFAALVARHDGLVLGVCRRILHDEQDAEDARQAAFLILARKASSIAKAGSLASWLHGVAFRVAAKLRAARSRARHAPLTDVPAPTADLSLREAQSLLDDELRKLPERLRQPLVLCYLEGKTRDEAAAELGWSVGTVRGRLERGRTRLRDRLRRRGVEFPGLLLPALLASDASAACATRSVGPSDRLPFPCDNHRVAGLAEGVLRAMSLQKTKLVLSVCLTTLALAALVIGAGVGTPPGRTVAAASGQNADPKSPPDGATKDGATGQPARHPAQDQELAKKVRKSMDRAVAWFKQSRNKDGTWEPTEFSFMEGGATSLAVLALLNAGVPADDRDLIPAINYLRQLEPRHTYVVGLQTAAFCKLNEKKDADLIRRNVAWLEKSAVRKDGRLLGWSYQLTPDAGRADNSNTQYAVMALYEAHRAGFKVTDKDFWKNLRVSFVAMQHPNGGWGYTDAVGQTSHTMTLAGLCCLSICDEVLPSTVESRAARGRGFTWLGEHFSTTNAHAYYNLYGIARLGKLSGKAVWDGPKKVQINWYRQGAEWLLQSQQADGSFKGNAGPETVPAVSTSFALLFLSAGD